MIGLIRQRPNLPNVTHRANPSLPATDAASPEPRTPVRRMQSIISEKDAIRLGVIRTVGSLMGKGLSSGKSQSQRNRAKAGHPWMHLTAIRKVPLEAPVSSSRNRPQCPGLLCGGIELLEIGLFQLLRAIFESTFVVIADT